jgi:hypothetical protein
MSLLPYIRHNPGKPDMLRSSLPTGYARLTPLAARGALLMLLLATGFFVAVTLSPLAGGRVGKPMRGAGDVALYQAEVQRVHDGQQYYQAIGTELRERGYPTGSVFNWRTPLPVWLIGSLPAVVLGKALLGFLALLVVLLAFGAIAREENNSIGRPLLCVLLLSGPLLFCIIGELFVMPVLWSGVLIALSICAYGTGRWRLGLAAGLAAVFLRELALPYCLLAAALAYWNKRRGETLAWAAGLAVFFLLFALHCLYVNQLILPADRMHPHGWMRFGGAGFVIAVAQVNAYLLLLPQWVTALYLAAALFGFAGWNTPFGQRAGLTACLFLAGLAVVGQDFNQYWGCLVAPLLCLGVARFPASLRDALHAAELTRAHPVGAIAD